MIYPGTDHQAVRISISSSSNASMNFRKSFHKSILFHALIWTEVAQYQKLLSLNSNKNLLQSESHLTPAFAMIQSKSFCPTSEPPKNNEETISFMFCSTSSLANLRIWDMESVALPINRPTLQSDPIAEVGRIRPKVEV